MRKSLAKKVVARRKHTLGRIVNADHFYIFLATTKIKSTPVILVFGE